MNFNREEVETHLDIITGYLNFIVSLNEKYIYEKPNIRYKLVLKDLIYYSDGLLERLTNVFDYILRNFKNTENAFLLCLELEKKPTIDKICRSSLIRIKDIGEIQTILKIVLRVIYKKPEFMDEIYLEKDNLIFLLC